MSISWNMSKTCITSRAWWASPNHGTSQLSLFLPKNLVAWQRQLECPHPYSQTHSCTPKTRHTNIDTYTHPITGIHELSFAKEIRKDRKTVMGRAHTSEYYATYCLLVESMPHEVPNAGMVKFNLTLDMARISNT